MEIGDKVRIKTEKELLAEGWTIDSEHHRIINEEGWQIWRDYCGKQYRVTQVDDNHFAVDYRVDGKHLMFPKNIVEVIPQTLDEFICNLPLEARAERFLYRNPIRSISLENDEGYYREEIWWLSAITSKGYLTYEEALQATIEALNSQR